ncbi:hypothetical protein LCGC14_1094490 [marine sediment metagenome]|uniref:Uncharacterized protein n=1 Tax=marine sediment metagenome TaxID=412755 RepID=A0A0F9MBE7_9ZZZZ
MIMTDGQFASYMIIAVCMYCKDKSKWEEV